MITVTACSFWESERETMTVFVVRERIRNRIHCAAERFTESDMQVTEPWTIFGLVHLVCNSLCCASESWHMQDLTVGLQLCVRVCVGFRHWSSVYKWEDKLFLYADWEECGSECVSLSLVKVSEMRSPERLEGKRRTGSQRPSRHKGREILQLEQKRWPEHTWCYFTLMFFTVKNLIPPPPPMFIPVSHFFPFNSFFFGSLYFT